MGALACLLMFQSVAMKFLMPEGVPEHFAQLGWALGNMPGLSVLELACTILYLPPRTSVLDVVLLTGYLGGAATPHVHIGDGVAPVPDHLRHPPSGRIVAGRPAPPGAPPAPRRSAAIIFAAPAPRILPGSR